MSETPVAAGKSSFDLIDREKTFTLFNIKPHSNCVDLACGVGNYCLEISKIIGETGTIYAVDLWQEGIDALNVEIQRKGIQNIQTIVADISKTLPLESGSIDSCLMATVVHDLSGDGQHAALKEAARLLKSDAVLNIIEFKKIDIGPGPPMAIRLDEKEIDLLVKPYGFEHVNSSEVGEYTYLTQYRKK